MEIHNNQTRTFTMKITIQLVVVFVLLGYLTGPKIMMALANQEQREPGRAVLIENVVHEQDPFSGIDLKAKSAYVWDINAKRELYNKEANSTHPLASLTKIMMALVANESIPENKDIVIRPDDLIFDGDQGLFAGETWKAKDLLDLTLVSSSNDGASALAGVAGANIANTNDLTQAKKAFINQMNIRAQALGLTRTKFSNESGLDIESYQSGATGSARDVARLLEYVYEKYPELLSATTKSSIAVSSENDRTHTVMNTNNGVEKVPGMIASKTGYTDLAGGNLAVVVDIGIGRPVAIVVLGSTRNERFNDVATLIDRATRAITKQAP